jgi:hypothetical protein
MGKEETVANRLAFVKSSVLTGGVLCSMLLIGCARLTDPARVGTDPTKSATARMTRDLSTYVPSEATSPVAGGIVFALLADNQLLAIRIRDLGVVAERRLASPPNDRPYRATGHYMALSKDGKQLFALVSDESGEAPRLVVLNTSTVEIRGTHLLNQSISFRSLVVGPTTGRLYLFGDQNGSAIVTVLDPESGTEVVHWIAREGGTYHWQVYEGAVSSDERHLFISYHGPDTTGVDRFEIANDGLHRCQTPNRPNEGCINAHGSFIPYRDGFLIATGTNVVLDVDTGGKIRKGFDTQLNGNHLTEFIANTAAGQIYAVGSCGYAGGFSVLDLATGGAPVTPTHNGWQWQTNPKPPQILSVAGGRGRDTVLCGERLALGPGSLLVIGKTTKPVATSGIPGALLILDVRTGRLLHTVATPSEPIDVLTAGLP